MTVYVELVLITNILIHLYTALMIKGIYHINFSKLFPFGLVLDVIYTILYIYYEFDYTIIKLLFGILLVFLSFKTNIKYYIRLIIVYYIFNFFLGGIALYINISINYFYLIAILIFGVISYVFVITFNITYDDYYIIKIDNKCYKAFLDTGNKISYKTSPVVIINEKYYLPDIPIDNIDIYTAIGYKNVPVYKKKVFVKGIYKEVFVIYLPIDFEAIINKNLIK